MSDFVSIEGPVENVGGTLVLRIPLIAGGDKLAKSAGRIGRIEGDCLRVDIPAWLAERFGLVDGTVVVVDNHGGTFNIELPDEDE
ncbi:MAG: hypothetical protein JSR60_03220 [Proteobacteria bacterium]|nr:hypothetical protein [Pseudomonadota bacterium]